MPKPAASSPTAAVNRLRRTWAASDLRRLGATFSVGAFFGKLLSSVALASVPAWSQVEAAIRLVEREPGLVNSRNLIGRGLKGSANVSHGLTFDARFLL